MKIKYNKDYYERAKLLRSHGMTTMSYERAKGHSTSYDVIELGYNYRIDDIRSSIAIVQLDKLKDDLEKRIKIKKMYVDMLSKNNKFIVPFNAYNKFASNYIFPIILKDSDYIKRDSVREKLAETGIQTSVHYPAVHQFSIYKEFYVDLPKTDYVVDNLITLPMYSKLTETDVEYITTTLESV